MIRIIPHGSRRRPNADAVGEKPMIFPSTASPMSCVAVAIVLLLGLATPALAQDIPALTALPGAVEASNPDLAGQRAALMQERTALHAKIDSLNDHCGSVDKGSAAAASCMKEQAQLLAALKSHIQQSNDFNAVAQAAIIASNGPALLNDPSVVDARNVPTGLPKSVEAEIPDTPAGNRVRKGFEAIMDHDWNVAHAWFQDALNHDPGNAGIQRLIDLAEYTMRREKQPPDEPVADSAQEKAAMKLLVEQEDAQMNEDLAKSLNDYNLNYRPHSAAAAKAADKSNVDEPAETPSVKSAAHWKVLFDSLFVSPPKVYETGAVRD
jgi:hypothetical protein